MICETGSFSRVDGDSTSRPKQKVSRKKRISSTNRENPYSAMGLDDVFSSVVADLEARKEKILAAAGAQGFSSVKFTYNDSQDCTPVVVKVRDPHRNQNQPQEKDKSKQIGNTNSKNPYSELGLDKFSSVMADLDEKREKILATVGDQGASSVKFTYNDSQDCVPIVMKVHDPHCNQNQHQEEEKSKQITNGNSKNPYSALGLEQFSSVMADLGARKEKILAKVGGQGVSSVKFIYNDSQDCVPIVVKVRDPHPNQDQHGEEEKSMQMTNTNSKNPYSAMGLDKFSSVMADLGARKEKILATAGTQGISSVKFKYNDAQDCAPVVVKIRDSNQDQHQEEEKSKKP